jgi:hypothetical protein
MRYSNKLAESGCSTGGSVRNELRAKLAPTRVRVSPKFHALLDFLLRVPNERWTSPGIESLVITTDGFMLIEHGNALFGSEADAIQNINGLADAVGLSDAERTYLRTELTRHRVHPELHQCPD